MRGDAHIDCGCAHDAISSIDAIVAKALNVNELTRVSRIEVNLRKYIGREWDSLAVQASKQAGVEIRAGSGDVTNSDINRMMTRVNRVMDDWNRNIEKRYVDDNKEVYELSHIAAIKRVLGKRKRPLGYNTQPGPETEVKKAKDVVFVTGDEGERVPVVLPSFTAVDLETMEAFENHQVFWIGRHYEENVSETVAKISRDTMVKAGLGRAEAGKIAQKTVRDALDIVQVPDGFSGSSTKYFEMLVANTVTTQRVSAQMTSFERFGHTKHVIVNPNDQRTCPICELMDGKVFEISAGKKTLNSLVNAKNPASVRRIQPFMTVAIAQQLTGGQKGPISIQRTNAIAARGNSMPPFHGKCRCSIDITEEEEIVSF